MDHSSAEIPLCNACGYLYMHSHMVSNGLTCELVMSQDKLDMPTVYSSPVGI